MYKVCQSMQVRIPRWFGRKQGQSYHCELHRTHLCDTWGLVPLHCARQELWWGCWFGDPALAASAPNDAVDSFTDLQGHKDWHCPAPRKKPSSNGLLALFMRAWVLVRNTFASMFLSCMSIGTTGDSDMLACPIAMITSHSWEQTNDELGQCSLLRCFVLFLSAPLFFVDKPAQTRKWRYKRI